MACGNLDDLVAFDIVEGGILCRSCRRGRPVSPDALALVRVSAIEDLSELFEMRIEAVSLQANLDFVRAALSACARSAPTTSITP